MSDNYSDFTIVITTAGSKQGLIVEATSMDTEISYNNVMVTEDVEHFRAIHRFQRQMSGYVGPDFSTLDERI